MKSIVLFYFYILLQYRGYDDVIIMNNFTILTIVIVFVSMIITTVLHLYLIDMKNSIVKIFLFIHSVSVSFFPTFSVIFSFFSYSNCFISLSLRVSPFSLLLFSFCLLVSFYFLFRISYFLFLSLSLLL